MDSGRSTSGDQPFFAASQWGCFLFLAALALVSVGSALRALSGGPTTSYEGVMGEVERQQAAPWRTSYHVTIAGESGAPAPLRLRNQGRILDYLQAAAPSGPVRITARDGVVRALTDLADGETIAEPEAPQGLLLASAILPFLLLAFFAWPWLTARRAGAEAARPVTSGDEEE